MTLYNEKYILQTELICGTPELNEFMSAVAE